MCGVTLCHVLPCCPAGPMEDVIEVMKLLCYEMMELQRTQQDPSAQAGPNSEVVWHLLQQQADTLVVLLTTQTGQVRTLASGSLLDEAALEAAHQLWVDMPSSIVRRVFKLGHANNGAQLLPSACMCPAGVHDCVCRHCGWPWSPAAHAHARLQVSVAAHACLSGGGLQQHGVLHMPQDGWSPLLAQPADKAVCTPYAGTRSTR